jgi:hypothetical protein
MLCSCQSNKYLNIFALASSAETILGDSRIRPHQINNWLSSVEKFIIGIEHELFITRDAHQKIAALLSKVIEKEQELLVNPEAIRYQIISRAKSIQTSWISVQD